jgi:hypothetical protein
VPSDAHGGPYCRAPHLTRSNTLSGRDDITRYQSGKTTLHSWVYVLPSHKNWTYSRTLRTGPLRPASLPVSKTPSMWVYNASAQVDQHSKYPMFICVCVVTNSMMVAAVSLRAYIRIRSCRVGWDDFYIFVAAVCLTNLNVFYHGLTPLVLYHRLHSRCSMSDTS